MNKKVLIITYYWPPSGGSGVQRWLKFVKYLNQLGWEPYVFTPENPAFTTKDDSLLQDVPHSVEVIRFPIWEPYHLFLTINRFLGKKNIQQADFVSAGKKTFLQKVSSWIRGNFFIPDARIFWVKPSTTFLLDFLQSNEISRIITTGPPHSMHLIGRNIKKKRPDIRWIADFRDPWSEWDLLDTFLLTSFARRRHKKLERDVLVSADNVITIAPYHQRRLEALSGRAVDLITNGFDEDDFPEVQKVRSDKFTIRHVGVVDELRNPRPFLEVIKEICSEREEIRTSIRIEFVGNVNLNLQQEVVNDEILNSVIAFTGQLPHDKISTLYNSTDLQLLVLAHTSIAPGNLPGKFFEYLASGNPILGIGPEEGDAADVLRKTHAGIMCERTNKKKIKESLLSFYLDWKNEKPAVGRNISDFTRRKLTEKLVDILNK